MTGKLRDLTINRDKTQNITVTVGADFREEFDRLKDGQVEITIKPRRNRRSKDANSYAWLIIDRIAEAMNVDKVDVYRSAIRSIGGVSETVCTSNKAVSALCEWWESNGIGWVTETMPSKIQGCTNVVLYCGSSQYDKAQMSRLIDHLLQDAETIGLAIDKPTDLVY